MFKRLNKHHAQGINLVKCARIVKHHGFNECPNDKDKDGYYEKKVVVPENLLQPWLLEKPYDYVNQDCDEEQGKYAENNRAGYA